MQNPISRVFKALGSSKRVKLLEELAATKNEDQCICVGSLKSCNDVSDSTLSHHLKELSAAGLISTERKGKNIYCQIDIDQLDDTINQLQKISDVYKLNKGEKL